MSNVKTVLVTGAAGFIASNFCKWLIDNTDFKVIGIDNLSGGFKENLPDNPRFIFQHADINDDYINYDYLGIFFTHYKPDVCYHMAAYASEGRSNHIRRFIHKNNTVGSMNVINCCINYNCKLVFTSSVAVYSGTPPFSEKTIPNPIDEYALSKWTTERSIQIAGEVSSLDWCIVRPRNVYGIGQSLLDPSRNLFGIFCYNAKKGLPLNIFGDGKNQRTFTYIDDLMKPLYNAMFWSKEIFNIGSAVPYSIKDATDIFMDVSGYNNYIHTEARDEVPDAICEIDKSVNCLDFVDKTTLREGLQIMWEWAKNKEVGDRQIPPQLEITKNAHISLL